MRLFVAVDIESGVRAQIARFAEALREAAPDARWVKPQSYHITLKFLGECSEDEFDAYRRALAEVRQTPFAITFRGCGFFPTARSPRAFWAGIEGGEELPALAAAVEDALAAAGAAKEDRRFSPHLTLARGPSGGKGGKAFARLQERLSAIATPSFGTMTAREFLLYQSRTSPQGAIYSQLQRFALE